MPKNKKGPGKFKNIETRITDEAAEIWIYGTITQEKWSDSDVTSFEVIKAVNAVPTNIDKIIVHLNSGGGDVFEGTAIYETLKNHRAYIEVIGEGFVGSIASVIAMAADNFIMTETSLFWVHNPLLMLFGGFNRHELEKMQTELDTVRDVCITAYTAKTGLPEAEIVSLLDGDNNEGTYLTPTQAFERGFCDSIGVSSQQMVAYIPSSVFRCRGKTIPIKAYNPKKNINGGDTVPKTRKRNMKVRPRAELLPCTCPYCQTQCTLDTDTLVVSIDPTEGATVATPDNSNPDYEAARKQVPRFRAEKYSIECPSCHGEFEVDTTPGTETTPVVETPAGYPESYPIPQAKKTTAKVKAAKPKPKPKAAATIRRPRMDVYPVHITCTECDYEFDIDVDGYIEEAVVTCPNCEAELDIDTTDVGEDYSENENGEPAEEDEVAVAMRRGAANERNRLITLDARAKAFPQFAAAIEQFKKNGSSVDCVNNWIFKALEGAKSNGGGAYLAGSRKDAQVLQNIGFPSGANKNDLKSLHAFNSLAQRRGTLKNA